ncbi:MAG: ZIP family metal transporter [Saprospiraceae bacterium]
MTLWQYLILFLSVLAGGLIALQIQKNKKSILKIVLSFSGAYLLGITVLHLLPSVFFQPESNIGVWILGGFFIQLLLERLSQGVEHGHIHAHKSAKPSFAIQIMLGLCLHAFMEGLPLSNYHDMHHHSHGVHESGDHLHLFYGIILHKIPAAFALGLLLLRSDFSRKFILGCLVIFALMSPLGAFTSALIAPEGAVLNRIMAIVVGSFLHIATTILFETDDTHHHRISWQKLCAILVGIGLALLTMH